MIVWTHENQINLESLHCKEIQPVSPKGNQSWIFTGAGYSAGCWSWNSNTLATWCKELTHWKRSWCCERLKAAGEGDDRGWDGWTASLTQWRWVWVGSGSWWWIGRPGVLQSNSQRVGHDWATELNWTDHPKKLGPHVVFPMPSFLSAQAHFLPPWFSFYHNNKFFKNVNTYCI